MIIAPDVFATGTDGKYTPEVAVDWVAEHGTPSPLYIGRTLRYTPETGLEFGPATAGAKTVWKPLADAPKSLRTTIAGLGDLTSADGFQDDRAAHYELIGPKIAKNPHGLDSNQLIRHGATGPGDSDDFTAVPTTSLWALARTWFPDHTHLGILWTWNDEDSEWPRHAVVRRDRLPALR
jgi:hypothetical protein